MLTLVEKVILEKLEGVGVPEERHQELGEYAMHFRRPMTPEEEAGLPRKPCPRPEKA